MKSFRSGLAILGVAALAGCDLPTEAPTVEQRWVVPLENTSIAVNEFLPDGVSPAGDLFDIDVEPFAVQSTLGELCSSCADGGGPVPAFEGVIVGSQVFPAGLLGEALESGAVAVAVENGLSFDPTEGGGSVIITLTDGPGGKVLGETSISSGMAPGSTVTRGITLAGGSAGPKLVATTVVRSVGGQSGPIDTSQLLVVSLDPTSVLAAFVTVDVANRVVSINSAALGVSDIDSTISDHITSGRIKLDITNPFGVAVNADLVIDYPGGTLSRTLDLERTAVSTASASYSGDEFRSFLGKDGVTLTGSGVVSNSASPITVRVGEQMVIDATIDLTLIIG